MKPHERIILALDVSNIDSAIRLVNELSPYVGLFKIGFEAIYSTMADLISFSDINLLSCVRSLRDLSKAIGKKIFLDVKLCDTPNTVEKAVKAIVRMNPAMFNIHASAGEKAIVKAVANKGESKLFGVTVLTSIKEEECQFIFGTSPDAQVMRFAQMLVDAGADGVICAPQEGQLLRLYHEFDNLLIACPNVRPDWISGENNHNKNRQMTPYEAIRSGIDILVVGRPITNPPPEIGGSVNAAKKIAEEIESALSKIEIPF